MPEEKQIDWSKAPEWARVLLQNRLDEHCTAWAEAYEEGSRFFREDLQITGDHLKINTWNVLATRPAAWSGEGRPPVGLPVEWFSDSQTGWQEIVVLAYHGDDSWIRPKGKESMIVGNIANFRPIRTAEQIAAEERDKAITAMWLCVHEETPQHTPLLMRAYADLYDAGYRRIEVKE